MGKTVFLGFKTNSDLDLQLRIKQVVDECGTSMKAVAELVGISPSYLSRVNSGGVTPNVKLLQKIADALDVPVHRLICTDKGFGHFYVDKQWEGIRKT